jgi:putative transposase
MANHYHLLLEIDEPEKISAAMAGLNLSYTHYHHKKYQGGGFLWQGRFKAQPVQRENYLLACGRYIERNPVRAGIVMEASEYVFSSARYYCLGEKDGITVESPSFAQFGLENISRRKAYISFLRDFNREVEGQFAALDNPVGDKEFIKRLISLDGRFMPRRRGRPAKDLLRNHLALR